MANSMRQLGIHNWGRVVQLHKKFRIKANEHMETASFLTQQQITIFSTMDKVKNVCIEIILCCNNLSNTKNIMTATAMQFL